MAQASTRPAGSRSVYRVYTLGRFQVCRDDTPLEFPVRAQRKPLELLKVLIALGGAQVAEESLCDALWPDTDGDLAHGTLGSTLHRLRRLIGAESLLLRDRRLTLRAEHCWVDAIAFTDALEHATQAADDDDDTAWAHLERALTLYRGPFLQGESAPAEILAARERLHGMFLRHLRRWGEHYAARDDPERAAVLYDRGLDADPLAEELYQALMRLHLGQGRAAEGIAVYRRCQELLQGHAGVAPSAETERLYEACLAARNPPMDQGLGTEPAPQSVAAPAAVPHQPLLPPTDQPSIAILAFDNLSGDPAQGYFGDGLSENLITRLAAIPNLLVIARSSSFAYKGKAVDVRQIGRELGVRYVLEGSVLRADQRIRVTAQLIDAASGKHLWAEHYDRELDDFFEVLDEITLQVVTQLEVKLTMGVHARIIARGTNSVSALDNLLRGRELFMRLRPEDNRRARELARVASELDPGFAWALALEGWTHEVDAMFGWGADRDDELRRAEELAHRALAADPDTQFAHSLLSRVYALSGRLDEAIVAGRRAVELTPNDAYPAFLLSHVLVWAGQAEESLRLVMKALRLQPHPDTHQLFFAAHAHYFTGQYEKAAAWYRRLLERDQQGPLALISWYFLVVALVRLGRLEEARSETQKLLEAHPDFSIAEAVRLIHSHPYRDFSFVKGQVAHLRNAGLPD